MTWSELQKKGNKLYHLSKNAKKKRIRKKNKRRVEEFKKKYSIPVGPIPKRAIGGHWYMGTTTGNVSTEINLEDKKMFGTEIAFDITGGRG